MVDINDFKKLDLRVAKIVAAERVEGSDKLLKLQVDLGESDEAGSGSNFSTLVRPDGSKTSPVRNEISNGASSKNKKQIIAGIGKKYEPQTLVGREIVIIANLEPKTLMGLESQGMLLAADSEDGPVLLKPDQEVPPGVKIR